MAYWNNAGDCWPLCNLIYKSYLPCWTSQIETISVISESSIGLCCLDPSMWYQVCCSRLVRIMASKDVYVPVSRTYKYVMLHGKEALKLRMEKKWDESKMGRLSWIIWVVPVESQGSLQEEEGERTEEQSDSMW